MKKGLLLLLLLLTLSVLLTGCGEESKNDVNPETSKQETMHCESSIRDVVNGYETTSKFTIYYTGDYVDKVETVETVTSESEEFLDNMEEYINSTYDAMNSTYGGYSYEVIREDGSIVSNVVIDYSKMDLEQYITDQPTMSNYVENDKLLVEGIVDIYEEAGATCE
mgnify:FL=1